MTSANQTLGQYKVAPLVANQLWGANQNKPDLFWAILSLVLPVTVGHTTACHRPALAFSAAIHFTMKRSAPCSAVLRHSPSSWAAVVHWSALIPKALSSFRKHPISLFFMPTHAVRALHQLSKHHALRQSRTLHARHKHRKQNSPPA